MHNLATPIKDVTLHQTLASVVSTEGELIVATRKGNHPAKRAVSCLVEPRVGDRVMVAVTEDARAWVLAVLERDEDGVTLAVEGDLELRPTGRLSLSAKRGIDLAGNVLSLVTGKLELNAAAADVVIQRMGILGRVLRSEIDAVKSYAGTFDMVMDRFSQKVRRSYRTVSEMDELRAGRIDHRSKGTMDLRGKDTLMSAERLVKVDGEQIHMG